MANSKMRRTLEAGGMVVAPGAYDTSTARLIQSLGFEYLYVGGNQTGIVNGIPEPLEDVTLLSEVGRTVVRACREELPVILDASAGFGDPVHVMHTVESFELAGITAIHIEDQFFPKRVSYHRGLEHIVPIDVYQQRLEYALKARKNKDFLIIGRTDGARATVDSWLPNGGSREEALKRAHAAVELGVDVLMILGAFEKEDYKYLRSQIKDIPMVGLIKSRAMGVPDFQDLGYQIIIYPRSTIVTVLAAVSDIYGHLLKNGRPPTVNPEQEVLENRVVNALIGTDKKAVVEAATIRP